MSINEFRHRVPEFRKLPHVRVRTEQARERVKELFSSSHLASKRPHSSSANGRGRAAIERELRLAIHADGSRFAVTPMLF